MKYPMNIASCVNDFSLKNDEVSLDCDIKGNLHFNASSMSYVASSSAGFFDKGEFVGLPFPFVMAGHCYKWF